MLLVAVTWVPLSVENVVSLPGSCGNAPPALEQSPPCTESVPSGEDGMSGGEDEGSAAGTDPRGRGKPVTRVAYATVPAGRAGKLDFHLDGASGCRGELCHESG